MSLSLRKHMGAALALITGGFFPHAYPQGPEGHLARASRVIPVGGDLGFVVDKNMVAVVEEPDATIAAEIPIGTPAQAEDIILHLEALLTYIEARAELGAGSARAMAFPGCVCIEVSTRAVVLRLAERVYTAVTALQVAQLVAALTEVVAHVEARAKADQNHHEQSNGVEKWPKVAKAAVSSRGLPSRAIASEYK